MNFRQGSRDDEDWLYELFRDTMQEYIDSAWGWDELFQREGFITTLPARNFTILQQNEQRLGCFHLSNKPDHLLLDMILVPPQLQRRGYGRHMMDRIKETARSTAKPVRLSVLKTNPAIEFHRMLGFHQYDDDAHSLKFNWIPD